VTTPAGPCDTKKLRRALSFGEGVTLIAEHLRSEDPCGSSHLEGTVDVKDVNVVLLAGVIAEEPRQFRSPDGGLATMLTLDFPAPDARGSGSALACTFVEVPEQVRTLYDRDLNGGSAVLVVGQISNGGDILASSLLSVAIGNEGSS
jgi:hypothetical protein